MNILDNNWIIIRLSLRYTFYVTLCYH